MDAACGVAGASCCYGNNGTPNAPPPCDFAVLLGDDVTLKSVGWCDAVEAAFERIAARVAQDNGVPLNSVPRFGCVALHDETMQGATRASLVSLAAARSRVVQMPQTCMHTRWSSMRQCRGTHSSARGARV